MTSATMSLACWSAFSYTADRSRADEQNWLQGQDEARAGQQSSFKSQLDRIEHKVSEIAERTGDLPPLSRSRRHGGDDDGSPPSSPSSTTSTARPITPPAKLVPDGLADQLDDMRRLLGTVIGQNKDLMDEVNRRRSWDAEVPHLLRRALLKLGDDEFLDAHPPAQPPPRSAAGGSLYDGAGSIYSDDLGSRVKGPPNSFTESHEALVQKRFSAVPDSLLDGEVPDGDFDEELAMRDMPPEDPPQEHILPKVQVPAHLLARRQQQQQPQQQQTPQAFGDDEYSDAYTEVGDGSPPPPPPKSASTTPPPIPYRDEGRDGSRSPSMYSEDEYARDPNRRGMPPPQPVDLPTPVRSPGAYPPHQMGGQPNLGFRPGFPGGGMPMPRPPLPRIAGVRDPISST